MLCRTVGALAALSVGANAILLPPGISKIADHRNNIASVIDPKAQAIKLPCPGCAFGSKQESATEADDAEDLVWIQGGANDVLANFSISGDDKALMLNGVQLYPVEPASLVYPTLGQVRASASLAEIRDHPEIVTPLRVSKAGIYVTKEVISPAGDKLIGVNYEVGGLESQPMHFDGIEVKLLEGADDTLLIIAVETTPDDSMFGMSDDDDMPPQPPAFKGEIPPPPPAPVVKECNILPAALCKWTNLLESKIAGLKPAMPHVSGGCGGRKPKPHALPGHVEPQSDTPDDDEPAEGDRPHRHPHHGFPPHPHRPDGPPGPHGPHGPHGMHHGHHHRHHLFHGIVRAFVAVLIPVMAGITMGMFVSLIGMLVGRLVGFLWIKFRHGGQRGYASVGQSDDETESLEKGAVVEDVAEEEPLPKYEDAPAYEKE